MVYTQAKGYIRNYDNLLYDRFKESKGTDTETRDKELYIRAKNIYKTKIKDM